MNDDQLLRYSRQIMLPEVDAAGQRKLLDSRVLIIGAGGLGSAAAMYLAAAGVGEITIADDDDVELSNLQRQLLHTQADLGRAKVESAAATLQALNPDVRVRPLRKRLLGADLETEVERADAVVDGCDNFATRFAVNRACLKQRKPLISGAAIRMEGQVSVFLPGRDGSPCYRCLYADTDIPEEETCTGNGVLAPVVGIIGSVQALETIKVLLDIGASLCGRVLMFDGQAMEWRLLRLKRDPDCPDCARSTGA